MIPVKYKIKYPVLIFFAGILLSCHGTRSPKDKALVTDPMQMDQQTAVEIRTAVDYADKTNGKVDDSIQLSLSGPVGSFYRATDHHAFWSSQEKWLPLADSLYQYMDHAEYSGLFKDDYHFTHLRSLKEKMDRDSLKRTDAALWTRADLMLTDGLMHIMKDLKRGRLRQDSLRQFKDSMLTDEFFLSNLKTLSDKKQFSSLLHSLEPDIKGYQELKKGIPAFLDSMDRKKYTYVTYPYKKGNAKDSIQFIQTLQQRLGESGFTTNSPGTMDSSGLKAVISAYQKMKGLTADGKVSTALMRSLNTSDLERFRRIAITLDRYKLLPDKMPERYIWVNLPGFYLRVYDHDTVALESKIICGKPDTRTPQLSSQITDMVTYPTWTVPNSIIVKSYLPKLKHNPNYISRIGLKLVNSDGETVDPTTINWGKYKRGIPFKVMQASGDNNALGVLKFNFNNKYAVYLHDTNQRYLFKNAFRALSHGCVRVQEWQKLANYIARNDSINRPAQVQLQYNTDSIRTWIAEKVRHRIDIRNQVSLFIRYFTCEGINGRIRFYDDIYGEDKLLREKYFTGK